MFIKNFISSVFFACLIFPVFGEGLFSTENPVVDGINVVETSKMFSEIYQKLDTVSFGGKSLNFVVESLDKISPKASIFATDNRLVLSWDDVIVANYVKPEEKNWDEYGEITTAMMLKMRQNSSQIAQMSENDLYQVVVDALLTSVDERGKYISDFSLIQSGEDRVLTSIGITGWRDTGGEFRVGSIVSGSPADLAGIQVFDLIAEINGESVPDMSDADLDMALWGNNSGTDKMLLLTPYGEKNVVVRRASIIVADVDVINRKSNDKNILEFVVHKISDNAGAIINEALEKYENVQGIVLDLRVADGENIKSAAKIAGSFIGEKPVMRIIQQDNEELEVVPGGKEMTDAPVVVLISDTTRGTAELIASAFYENRRGVLVGTPTAGFARLGNRIELSNGGALQLLNQSMRSGNGRDIDGRGVFPIVCLSSINSEHQQNVFFINLVNNDFNAQDFNADLSVDVDMVKNACPSIKNGAVEDALSVAMAVRILMDDAVYQKLLM